jgi:hypothetical protein
MRNVLGSAAVGAVIGVGAAMLVAATGVGSRIAPMASGKKNVHATIWLDRVGGSGPCTIVTTPQTLEAFKRETVEWSIVDRCGVLDDASDEVVITFTGTDPTASGCVKRGKKKIRCSLNNPGVGFYKYQVEAPGAVTEDPELEIVQ